MVPITSKKRGATLAVRLGLICMFACISCQDDKNLATCTLKKTSIEDISTVADLEAEEAKIFSSTCTTRTYQEDAEILLRSASLASADADKIDLYTEAANIFQKLAAFYPEDLVRLRVAAVTYAAAAGIEDLLVDAPQMVTAIAASDYTGVIDFLFDSPSTEINLQTAVTQITNKISQSDGTLNTVDTTIDAICRFSLIALSLNAILARIPSGELSADTIAEMSEEELLTIVNNIESIDNPAVQAFLPELEGLTDDEKRAIIAEQFGS